MSKIGQLTLVGAGPGDPDLITIKGANAIASAEVILYDALVNKELLKYAVSTCTKIFVGKRAGQHSAIQEEINQLIVEHALKGKHVVRLKGGDPFIFARGKEEIDYAKSFGIPTEAIIGISSINLPGYYGIPLTTRGINQSFWVVTATDLNGKLSDDAKLAAQSSATVVFFMGLRKLREIVELYLLQDKASTPVAIISQGSLPTGKVVHGTIETILDQKEYIPTPALIVVGESVGEYLNVYQTINISNGNHQ
ncbi:Uroporphyrinogen-III methyltransferase [Fulvivirga imtechensis AK7]|uniref:uroporphyrinogen-III C-methyltransferase n=1 Tax=Fulvivirga imtechensis AK7 TaxID=1237149 RepID=L8JJJ0_9BACT|nr:uroporphyrinogen-III C-methyltransferase [Fulvivirga imtechensis]ELR69076.1 Uroporphyrinogen-III methyltransferase [Fulvivirga imtechensis AK7]